MKKLTPGFLVFLRSSISFLVLKYSFDLLGFAYFRSGRLLCFLYLFWHLPVSSVPVCSLSQSEGTDKPVRHQ